MIYYKLYLQDEDGTFFTYFQSDYCRDKIELGVKYTAFDLKADWIKENAEELKEEEDDAYFAPIYGLTRAEAWRKFIKGYYPCDIECGIQEDIAYATQAGTKRRLVLVECEGDVHTEDDPYIGSCDPEEVIREYGDEGELWFDTQTVLRVVRVIDWNEVVEIVKEAWAEQDWSGYPEDIRAKYSK